MINIVVALPAEARPLIKHFNLQRKQELAAYPVYQKDAITLIITGVGKIPAATAISFLYEALGSHREMAWLNVGVAGHRSHEVGKGFLVPCITDVADGKNYYPPTALPFTTPRESLISVETPQEHYPETKLVDMEASGFYKSAACFSTGELVQCYKIVSDNDLSPAVKISGALVESLINGQLKTIRQIALTMDQYSNHIQTLRKAPQEMGIFEQHWRFTVSEHHQLRQLLRRWQVLSPGRPVWSHEFQALPTAKDVLDSLRIRVDSRPIQFGVSHHD